jgi:hypothetical protein
MRVVAVPIHPGLAKPSVRATLRDAARGAVNVVGSASGRQASMGATTAATANRQRGERFA